MHITDSLFRKRGYRCVLSICREGGNAIDLAYEPEVGTISRASFDLDYSIDDGDFTEDQESISKRIKNTLTQTFLEHEYVVIDYKFLNKPKKIAESLADFWGGYKVEFKVVEKKKFDENIGKINKARNSAVALNPNQINGI